MYGNGSDTFPIFFFLFKFRGIDFNFKTFFFFLGGSSETLVGWQKGTERNGSKAGSKVGTQREVFTI